MRSKRWLILLILLVAAALRLVDLGTMPPGLEHDEVANWLIDREILAGEHRIYFTAAYGHEAGYHYVQSAAVALFGDHVLGLRLPSVFAGMLVIATSFALSRRLFGETAGLVSAGLLATLWWPLFFSRLGIRAISLPAVSGFAALFFWRGVIGRPGKVSIHNFLVAGIFAGMSLYTYMASRAVPLIFVLFIIYLAVFHRSLLREHRQGLIIFVTLMVLVALPLFLWLAGNPGAEYRISEVDQPLVALMRGDLGPVVDNGIKLLGFFIWRGDPLIRQNIPGRPVFDPLGALLFVIGLGLMLYRWRRPRYAFALLWLVASLTPSLVTIDAPSSIRCINALVVMGVPVGLAVGEICHFTGKHQLFTWLTALWIILATAGTVRAATIWGQDAEVRFVWQTALMEAAAVLEAEDVSGTVVVGGWTPKTMDPPTMDLYLQRQDLSLRFVTPTEAILLPSQGGWFLWPSALPPDPLLDKILEAGEMSREERGQIMLAILPAASMLVVEGSDSIVFDGGIACLGWQSSREQDASLLTKWRAGDIVQSPLSIFLHVVDDAGVMIAQDDGLDISVGHWQPGDIVVQLHRLDLPAGEYGLRFGLYNPTNGQRLHFRIGQEEYDQVMIENVKLR